MTAEALTTRVESQVSVESPGNLPSIVRLDNMRFVHFSRNPIITRFLKAHKFVREFGEGVDRMYRELKEAGNPTPKYEQIAFMIVGTAYSSMYELEGEPTVVAEKHTEYGATKKNISKALENPPVNPADTETTAKDLEKDLKKDLEKDLEKISKNQKRILDLMQSNPYITQEELSKEIGINAKNIRNNIQKLKAVGLITRVGPDKGGYWQVTAEKE